MLDRTKIIKELAASRIGALENILTHERHHARVLWERITHNPDFYELIRELPERFALPAWTGMAGIKKSPAPITEYNVTAIDGSQIYPDRHQGIDCFVINIGTVHISYRADKSSVFFESEPLVQFPHETTLCDDSPEEINALRTELEFKKGTLCSSNGFSPNACLSENRTSDTPYLVLFDGSLIFWHLHSTQSESKNAFLSRYLKILDELFDKKIAYACYISLPKSRELINILRAAALLFKEPDNNPDDNFDHLDDTDIADFYLAPGERSIIFRTEAPVTHAYPAHSTPHFFYINTGCEIGRVEIPAWIAQDPTALSNIESIIHDQLIKGFGYPIALAESHEQAVINTADREFFYTLLRSMAMHRTNIFRQSQKLMRKQRAGI